MTRTMLVPFDGSAESRAALGYARELAPDERLLAFHVVEPVLDPDDGNGASRTRYERAFEHAHDRLEEAEELSGGAGPLDVEFHYGHPLHEILLSVDRYVVDEVVMGSLGRDDTEELLLGNVAESVVRRSPVPVTVVRSAGTGGDAALPESVLVPFDGSTPSRDALTYAIERFPGATIKALFADYPASGDAEHLGPGGDLSTGFEAWYGEVKEWHERADRDPESVLHIAETVADAHDRDVRTVTERGSPTHVVLEHAEWDDVDHVVLGNHSHEGVTRKLLGSVAGVVVRRSPTSVTVVR